MDIIQFIAVLLIIILLIMLILYSRTMIRKVQSTTDQKFISSYLIILVSTFFAGGIIRTIQQNTRYEWLNGFVTIFGGLFVLLWAVPFFWRISQKKLEGIKRLLFLLPGLIISLFGLGIIYMGISSWW